jgi:hypothetical protein
MQKPSTPRPNTGTARRWLTAHPETNCVWCSSNPATEIDHVTAVVLGGSDDASNFTFACRPCNRRRGTQATKTQRRCVNGARPDEPASPQRTAVTTVVKVRQDPNLRRSRACPVCGKATVRHCPASRTARDYSGTCDAWRCSNDRCNMIGTSDGKRTTTPR